MEGFDINNIDLSNVQDTQFSPIKDCVTTLKVEKIEQEKDDKGRQVIVVRHTITGQAETVIPNSKPGSIFNRLYLHNVESLPFLRRFVEAHGIDWDSFMQNRDLSQFIGLEAQAKITYDSGYDNNKVKQYIKKG